MRPLTTALLLVVLPSLADAQLRPKTIPLELGGFRLGEAVASLPPDIRATCQVIQITNLCGHGNIQAHAHLRGEGGQPFRAARPSEWIVDMIVRTDTTDVHLSGPPEGWGDAANEVWRRIAYDRASQLFHTPDSVLNSGATVSGFWTIGVRHAYVVAEPRNGIFVVRLMVYCAPEASLGECLQ
jgi:hypothetical protein